MGNPHRLVPEPTLRRVMITAKHIAYKGWQDGPKVACDQSHMLPNPVFRPASFRHEEKVDAWLSGTTRNADSERKPLAPVELRAAQGIDS